MGTCDFCGAKTTVRNSGSFFQRTERHDSPCGAVCTFGCASMGEVPTEEERAKMHDSQHRSCPKGCFTEN